MGETGENSNPRSNEEEEYEERTIDYLKFIDSNVNGTRHLSGSEGELPSDFSEHVYLFGKKLTESHIQNRKRVAKLFTLLKNHSGLGLDAGKSASEQNSRNLPSDSSEHVYLFGKNLTESNIQNGKRVAKPSILVKNHSGLGPNAEKSVYEQYSRELPTDATERTVIYEKALTTTDTKGNAEGFQSVSLRILDNNNEPWDMKLSCDSPTGRKYCQITTSWKEFVLGQKLQGDTPQNKPITSEIEFIIKHVKSTSKTRKCQRSSDQRCQNDNRKDSP